MIMQFLQFVSGHVTVNCSSRYTLRLFEHHFEAGQVTANSESHDMLLAKRAFKVPFLYR
jgi:hypothetical protein